MADLYLLLIIVRTYKNSRGAVRMLSFEAHNVNLSITIQVSNSILMKMSQNKIFKFNLFSMSEPQKNFALESYGNSSKCFDHTEQMWEERSCRQTREWQHWGSGCYRYKCKDGRLHIIVSQTKRNEFFVAKQCMVFISSIFRLVIILIHAIIQAKS